MKRAGKGETRVYLTTSTTSFIGSRPGETSLFTDRIVTGNSPPKILKKIRRIPLFFKVFFKKVRYCGKLLKVFAWRASSRRHGFGVTQQDKGYRPVKERAPGYLNHAHITTPNLDVHFKNF